MRTRLFVSPRLKLRSPWRDNPRVGFLASWVQAGGCCCVSSESEVCRLSLFDLGLYIRSICLGIDLKH